MLRMHHDASGSGTSRYGPPGSHADDNREETSSLFFALSGRGLGAKFYSRARSRDGAKRPADTRYPSGYSSGRGGDYRAGASSRGRVASAIFTNARASRKRSRI